MKLLLILALLVPSWAAAQAPMECYPYIGTLGDYSAQKRMPALLKARKFAALEEELNRQLMQYERGQYADLALRWQIGAMGNDDPETGQLAKEWLAAIPQSFFAQLLTAEYYAALGYTKRGRATAAKTAPEQFVAMEMEFKKAHAALEKAMRLRPKSALPYALLIQVNMAMSGAPHANTLLAQANKADPRNTAARHSTIYALQPRWGGSFADMDAIATQATHDGLSAAQVSVLRYTIAMKKAGHLVEIEKDKKQALAYWNQAAQLCHTDYPWTRISEVALELENWKLLEEASTQILTSSLTLRVEKDMSKPLANRGMAREKMGMLDAAAQDYEAALQQGNAWTQTHLGLVWEQGRLVSQENITHQKNMEQAIAWGNTFMLADQEAIRNTPKQAAKDRLAPSVLITGAMLAKRGLASEKKGHIPEAMQDYEQAIRMGSTWAQNHVSGMLFKGDVVPKDTERAMQLLRQAAGQDDIEAFLRLQVIEKLQRSANEAIVQSGLSHEKNGDIQAAVQDYERAAHQGDAWAQNHLGAMLIEGRLAPQDTVRGTRLLEQAAAQGHGAARTQLEAIKPSTP